MITETRILLGAVGVRTLVRMIRRRREAAAGGEPLSRSERLEQRGAAVVIIAFAVFFFSLVVRTPSGDFFASFLMYGAILGGIAGLGLYAASGVVEGMSSKPPSALKDQVGRNEVCPCGSGKKYKHCHGAP